MINEPIFEYSKICNQCDKSYRLNPDDKFKVCDHYDFSNCQNFFYMQDRNRDE